MPTYVPLTPFAVQFQDAVTSENLSGGSIEFYLAGTSTPTNLFSDDTGTSIGNSITLNSGGYPESGGNVIQLFRDIDIAYDFILKDASGAEVDDSTVPIGRFEPRFDQTATETAAGVTPINLNYVDGDYRRFTDDTPDVNGFVTFTVGSGGDFANINDALNLIYRRPPNGTTIVLQLVSGFQMQEQVALVYGQDYSWMRLESVDATVTAVRSSWTELASAYNDTPTGNLPSRRYGFFAYNGSILPVFGITLDVDTSGDDDNYVGILLHGGCHITILDGCGVTNLAQAGGSNDSRGINVTHGSTVTGWGADFTGCHFGTRVSNASKANFRNSDFSGCTRAIVVGGACEVAVQNANLSGCTEHAIRAESACVVHADSANLSSSGVGETGIDGAAIRVDGQGRVHADGANIDTCGRGIDAREGSLVTVNGASIDDCEGYGIFAKSGSRVIGDSATVVDSLSLDAVRCDTGAYINLANGTVTGAAGSGVVADGGVIDVTGATVSGNDQTGTNRDIEILDGGTVHAYGVTTTNGTGQVDLADTSVGEPNRWIGTDGILICELQNYVEDTAANIADATASINTTGKWVGKFVWDTTNNRQLRAAGTGTTSNWDVVDGSLSITPA